MGLKIRDITDRNEGEPMEWVVEGVGAWTRGDLDKLKETDHAEYKRVIGIIRANFGADSFKG